MSSLPQDATADMTTVNEEYKIWRKNTPFLYDLVVTHALEWPSLTAQWFPDKVSVPGKDYTVQRLLLGTHTSDGEQNYLYIVEVRLPKEETIQTGGASSFERSDAGSYGGAAGKIEIVQQIWHSTEVHRARYMPQNPNIIATKGAFKEVLVFDKTRHPSKPARNGECSPELKLLGHRKEGFGLAWSPKTEGWLASASEDHLVCMWDVNAGSSKESSQQALATFTGHRSVVADVAWHPTNANILASCGDDKNIILWDARSPGSAVEMVEAHKAEINCLAFNNLSENVLATGSNDKTVAMWDIRTLKQKVHTFESHTDDVLSVQWAPFADHILASSGGDRRVAIWDLTRIGDEQDPEDAEDGPPELMFLHAGHTDKIADFAWNGNDDWVIASVADDNVLQVWQVAENIREDDDEEEGEEVADQELE